MSAHSVLAPSAAHRWAHCSASLAVSKDIPNEASIHSAEGTVYHELSARVLIAQDQTCHWYIGQVWEQDGFEFTIDAANASAAQTYVDAIRRLPGELLVEVDLDTSPVLMVADQRGSGDAVVLDYDTRTIRVNDLKFGRGEVVYAHTPPAAGLPEWRGANEQLMLYGAAALYMFDFLAPWDHVELAIHQPRLGHYDAHTYTRQQVDEFCAWIRDRGQLAYDMYQGRKPLAFTPGDKACRWCPARGGCAARTDRILNMFPLVGAT